ncbi:Trm112 family protein [Candidatus Poribacteria bacterium]|nr:Trm112 family protein [Candidatus Poribacteria bacterium]
MNTEKQNTISQTLLEILACPACKGKIKYVEKDEKLVCQGECNRRYPIRDGIPVMLIDEAELPNTDNSDSNT